jgi:hypothetical protein
VLLEIVLNPSPDTYASSQFSGIYGQFFGIHGIVSALTSTVNSGTLYRQVCLSKSCPNNGIGNSWTSNRVVETSHG